MQTATTTPYSYRAYGCNLLSDMAFEHLLPGADPMFDTITIRRCDSFPDAPGDAQPIAPTAMAAPGYLSLNIPQAVDLEARDGTTLLYRPADGIEDTTLQGFLMGSGLGAVLMQRKLLVLHGNAVEIDGAGIICVGPSGVGKSTTAAGMMQRGFRVMSDDVCTINTQGQIIPGVPHVKLWQEAAAGLGVETHGLSRIRPSMEKYRVPMGQGFCADTVPVKRVYVLGSHHSDIVTCEAVRGPDKFLALNSNVFRLPFVDGLHLSGIYFQQLAALSKQVTVKRVLRPIAGFHLEQLLDLLEADASQQVSRT